MHQQATPDQAADQRPAHRSAWLLVLAVAFAMLFPVLMLRGMSLDGVVYATISRNMAVGIGDLWRPVYTSPPRAFYDHPPLGFFLESLMFRSFGDHWWVERLYSTLSALPAVGLIVLIWRRLVSGAPALRSFAWLPVALWVAMPAWSWIYRNNYLENTVNVFALLAVYSTLMAMANGRWWIGWTAAAAVGIAGAVLTKGPTGAFPVIAPALIWLAVGPGSLKQAARVQLALVAILAAGLAPLLIADEPRLYLVTYLKQQVIDSLQGRREIANSQYGRLQLLLGLARDLWLPALAAGTCVLGARKLSAALTGHQLAGPIRLCAGLAVVASIPIMISPKQTAYYTAPSWPYYCLALALWCSGSVAVLFARLAQTGVTARWSRPLQRCALAAMAAVALLSPLWAGRALRDRALMADVQRIGQLAGPAATIAIEPELERHWALHAYLYRLYYISAEPWREDALYRLQTLSAAMVPGDPPGWTHQAALSNFELLRRSGATADRATVPRR